MEQKSIKTIATIAKLVIAIIGVILVVMVMKDESPSTIQTAVYFTLIALTACIIVALLFGFKQFFQNIGKNKGMLVGLVGFLAICGVAYALAGNEVLDAWNEGLKEGEEPITAAISKRSGAGVYAVMILLGVAVATAIFSEVSKIIKR